MLCMISNNEKEWEDKPHPDAYVSDDELICDKVYLIEVVDMIQVLRELDDQDPIVYLSSYNDTPMLMIECNL